MTQSICTSKHVFLYVPNLIGYSRVAASLLCFTLMVFAPDQWFLATIAYIYSFSADLFDGMAARKLNQCSTFGGVLDMVTDRCSTLGLLFILYGEYGYGDQCKSSDSEFTCSLFRILFLLLAILDMSSHWCQMYSTASLNIHHKSDEGNAGRFFVVRWYYQIYAFFGYCCVSAEVTYIAMYVLAHVDDGVLKDAMDILLKICVPGNVMKQIVNVFQLCSACNVIAEHDAQMKNKSK